MNLIRLNVKTRPVLKTWALHQGQEALKLYYTMHALERAAWRQLKLDEFIYIKQGEVVEVELLDKVVHKLVIRKKLNSFEDLCMVLVPLEVGLKHFKVVTVYVNHQADKHDTLDTSRLGKINSSFISNNR